MKSAILYYSRGGATKSIAEKLQLTFASEMIFVEPEKAYGGYLSAVLRNGKEKLIKSAAKVKTAPADLSDCDVVFIGFPVWYGTMPDFMQAYIKSCNMQGKHIVPFAAAGANGRDSSLATVKELFSGCTVSDYFYTTKPGSDAVDAWIKELAAKLK